MVHLSRQHRVTTHVTVALTDHFAVGHTLAGIVTVQSNQLVAALGRVEMQTTVRVVVEAVRVPGARLLH